MRDVVGCCSLKRAPAAVDAALQCIIQMAAAYALQVLPFKLPLKLPFKLPLKLPFKLPFVCNGTPSIAFQSSVLPCATCYAADWCCLVSETMQLSFLNSTMRQLCGGSMHSVFACVQDQ